MDDADRAEDLIENVIEDAIEEARRGAPGPAAVGYCLFCGAPFNGVNAARRWCGVPCRDDWQAENDARMRKHGGH